MADRIPPPAAARCTADQDERLYRQSLDDPDGFWAEQARRRDWVRRPRRWLTGRSIRSRSNGSRRGSQLAL